ncbi:uncharacterized protein [Haliotis asinina]|uniref:uncharacterized protein n=1 Tax=Haliotis asinina TaxID=109174 RepID=UPI003531C287
MWKFCWLLAWILAQTLFTGLGRAEMFKDPGFEDSNPSSNWICAGCKMDISTDHSQGHQSVRITGRQADWAGPQQTVYLKSGTRYFIQAHIKQLNDIHGTLFQKYTVLADIEKNSGSHDYSIILENKSVYTKSGWIELSSYFQFFNSDYKSVSLRVNGPSAAINFNVDYMSLTEIPEDKNWKSEANRRIDQLRKNNVHFNVHVPSHVSTADLEIDVDLVKHGYPIGSQTTWEVMTQHPQYAKLFYYMFNWATLSNYYWEWSPPPRHNPDYSKATAELNVLHQHGVPVRAHNIFWGADPKYTPDWVQALSPDQVKQAVDERIQYIVKDTKGKVQHWDVNNELVHGHWFEDKTGDPDYTKKIFAKVHQADPNVKLFLNDYSVVSAGTATSAYLAQAKEFKAASVGLYGIGIQCHFGKDSAPDPTLIKKRLDQLATAGLPIWVTELDLWTHDENIRADWYETALRVLFSHPAVEGIILWGFWGPDHWRGPDAALVSGNNFQFNAAGKRYIDLLYKEWSTHVTHKVSSGTQFNVRGFHGDYRVVVKYHGNPVMQQTFTLGKQDKQVSIQITNVNHVIHIPTTQSPVNHQVSIQHPVSHIGENTMGHMASGSSNQMTCMSRYSGFTEVGDDKEAEVSCPSGYVLTGCSGKIKNSHDTRDGETISVVGGVAKCQAYDGTGTTAPAQAVARCCKLTGLKCDYRKSGPSQNVLNQRIETRCQNNMFATGCSAHSWFTFMDGTFPTTHSCIAQNSENHGNVEASAVCCSAPHLTCQVKTSSPSGDKLGDQTGVSCDQGWQLVGCSAYSEDGKLGGAYTGGNPEQCIAVNGAQRLYNEMGVVAYATCCRTH